MTKFKNVRDVVKWRLCLGCGACAYICPEDKIKLVDDINDGIRPVVDLADCTTCEDCLKVCPGYETTHLNSSSVPGLIAELKENWGPVLEIWEGYATDRDVRYNGSSGGLAVALATYCMEKEGMKGALHIGADPDRPWKNKTFFSKNSTALQSHSGSRYAPASPCDGLGAIESASGESVFIGKPCDVAGLRKAQMLKPDLDKNTGAAIGIFCAGTPSTAGTLDLLKEHDIRPDDVDEIRYRGKGWPGMFSVTLRGEKKTAYKESYMESWGFLQKYRPFRCYLCPDGTSELADISCGDPWYRDSKDEPLGYSLVLVRTERGRRIIRGAITAGYIALERATPEILEDSQKSLLLKRQSLWGRFLAMRMLFVPAPGYGGYPLFKNWLSLPLSGKIRSVLGTTRRIIQRGYYKSKPIEAKEIKEPLKEKPA